MLGRNKDVEGKYGIKVVLLPRKSAGDTSLTDYLLSRSRCGSAEPWCIPGWSRKFVFL